MSSDIGNNGKRKDSINSSCNELTKRQKLVTFSETVEVSFFNIQEKEREEEELMEINDSTIDELKNAFDIDDIDRFQEVFESKNLNVLEEMVIMDYLFNFLSSSSVANEYLNYIYAYGDQGT